MNDTVTDCGVLVPLDPVQESVNVVLLALSGGVTNVPLVAWVPFQPFEAAQLVALVLDQLSVVVSPTPIVVGLARRLTVGTDEPVIATVTDWGALVPPDPLQLNVYVLVTVSAPVD